MQNYVFQIDSNKQPLDMVHPARARKLQSQQKAKTFRTYPYVLINSNCFETANTKEYILKIDPGATWTGFAIQCGQDIVFRMELKHRGQLIKESLTKRAGFRRSRRTRKLRYRPKRFNRSKPQGWLAPSLRHRLDTTETWIKRFMSWCPIQTIEIELVRFDLQKLDNPEISGQEYQQGTLFGYEVREYLLEKWGRQCVYCGATNTPLQIEHIKAKANGGSDRIGNLTLACEHCNIAKGTQDVRDFLQHKPNLLKKILTNAPKPLASASAVNSTRFAIVKRAKQLCSDVKCWSGGRTKHNRVNLGLLKSHSIDAACVGESAAEINLLTEQPLIVLCKGHGTRQAVRCNASGFPALDKSGQPIKPKIIYRHCCAGDLVKFRLDKDRKAAIAGVYTARVKTPTKNGFEVKLNGLRVSQNIKFLERFIHRNDGYDYLFTV
ncbi:MAG: RNA-guided endonuclease IscB [Crocosphaera sp.]|nr:RNA-guided endonuclease IscB [Crocosphaera sp.]MDJ0728463.1 RNA-guided endonuclease IscB [Crocosphaera sp.]